MSPWQAQTRCPGVLRNESNARSRKLYRLPALGR